MTTPHPPLDESELKAILVGNTREFALNDAQRMRLRVQLGQSRDVAASELTVAATQPYELSPHLDHKRRPGRFVLSMAASLVVAVGFLGAMRVRASQSSTELRTQITPSDEATAVGEVVSGAQQARSFCEGEFAALDDAIRVWAGIENWSFLTDDRIPEPDLIQTSIRALTVLQDLRPTLDAGSTLGELHKLDADRLPDDSSGSLRTLTGTDRLAAEHAVQATVDILIATAGADTELAQGGCYTDWYSNE